MFGEMRPSTPVEQKEYRRMLNKYSIPIRRSIWNMGDIEVDYCDICHQKKQVSRKYYYYGIACDCCGSSNGHFEIVRHCEDCTPQPPKYISVMMDPVWSRD